MINKHRRRPTSPPRTSATAGARERPRGVRFHPHLRQVPRIEPRPLPSLAQPLRSSLRAPPVERQLDTELELGIGRGEHDARVAFGFVSPENRRYTRGDRVLSPRGKERRVRGHAVRRAPPRAPRRAATHYSAIAALPARDYEEREAQRAAGLDVSAVRYQALEEAPSEAR